MKQIDSSPATFIAYLWASAIFWTSSAISQNVDHTQEEIDNGFEQLFNAAREGKQSAITLLVEQGDSEKKYPAAQFRLGQLYYDPKNSGLQQSTGKAIKYWKAASENGYGRASFAIGNFYAKGEGPIASSFNESLRYYELAISQGYVVGVSQTRLARALITKGEAGSCRRITELLNSAVTQNFSEASTVISGGDYESLCK